MNKFTKIVSLSLLLLGISIAFLCTLPTNPNEDYSNTDISISSDSSYALTSLPTSFSVKLSFPNLIDSVVINYGDNSLPVLIHIKDNDSLMASQTNYSLTFKTNHTFLTDGEKKVNAIAYMSHLTKSSEVKLSVFKPAQFLPDSLIHVTGTLTLNTPISLSVNAAGTLPLHFTWYKNATAIPGSDNAVYTIPSFQITDTGSYFCVVSNTKGVDTCVTCKLQMSMILYSIQYNGNGNTSGVVPLDTSKYTTGSNIVIRSNTGLLTKTGATFAGWNTLADGMGTTYSADANLLMGTANIVLFARWTSNPTFTITYNGNGFTGGTVPVDGNSYETGITATIKSNSGSLVKTGFNFSGWSITPDGTGTSYTGGESVTIEVSNVVLYAKWTSNPTFTITYNGNGNTDGYVPIDATTYETGTKVIIQTNTGNLAKTGFTFAGWNTAADGSGVSYYGSGFLTIADANVLLYAKWTAKPVYTVTYDGNGNTGGKVPVDPNNYESGTKAIIKGNNGSLTKNGFMFIGWNTLSDGTGTSYVPDSTYVMPAAPVSLYAQWKINTYTVTYLGNGNTSGSVPDATTHEYNTPVIVKDNTGNLKKTGHNFDGWSKSTVNGTKYAAGSSFSMGAGNDTMYARWILGQYDITFDKNDPAVTGSMSAQIITFGGSATLTSNGFTKTGYSFAGWATSAGGDVVFTNGSSYTMATEGDTLYAKWTPNSYNVTFDKNDPTATGSMSAQTITFGGSATLTSNGFTKTGYGFAGWATSAGGDVVYQNGASYTMATEGDTLYAKWTLNPYNVTFDKNDPAATGSMSAQAIAFGSSAALTSNGFTKTEYGFAGWATSAGGDVVFTNGSSYTMATEGDTLYAKWTINQYNVTFNSQGGSTVDSQMVNYNDTAKTPAAPTRTGYTFGGWCREVVCTNQWTFATDKVTGNVTLYAQWAPNLYNVTFDKNDPSATGSMSVQTITFGSSATLRSNGFTKTGYSFAGWATSAGGDVVYLSGASYTMATEGDTLYAKWNNPSGMKLIPAAGVTFTLGDPMAAWMEQITLSKDFWIDTTEVTQLQYRTLMGNTYSSFTAPSWSDTLGYGYYYPVYYVSWFDAVLYCNARTKETGSIDTVYRYTGITGIPGNGCSQLWGLVVDLNKSGFRLPTEEEWEYACRGGTTTNYYWGKDWNPSYSSTEADLIEIDQYAVWVQNSASKGRGNPGYGTHTVATKLKNPFGLYDMSGNVLEWSNSQYRWEASGLSRVCRGGSWSRDLISLRSAYQLLHYPQDVNSDLGFRVCLPAQ